MFPRAPTLAARHRFGGLVALACAVLAHAQSITVTGPQDRTGYGENRENDRLFPELPQITFFPPGVPVYGARLPVRARQEGFAPLMLQPPDGLAACVNEWFYPALGTWLAGQAVNRKLQHRLDAYRDRRLQLLSALQDQLTLLQDADPDTRAASLRIFADTQAPALTALEREAEEIRTELVGGLLFENANWSGRRKWKIGETKFPREADEKEAEFQVIRAAAFYEPGLLPQQRGLLRELAFELQSVARAARGVQSPPRTDVAAMFFSPEMTRFELPPNLPPSAHARVARYNGEKAALKRELREAVVAHDADSPSRRAHALAELAAQQWPRFAALEKLAEEIRHDLAAQPQRGPPPAPPSIPEALLKEIDSFNADREVYYQERERFVRAAVNRVPPVPRDVPADERVQRQRQYIAERLQAQREAAQDFHRATQERHAALQQRLETIRKLLNGVAAAQKDPATGKPHDADSLLKHYVSALEKFDTYGREEVIYRNYRIAMLQPGLSPEQRRLLFGATVVGLAQPLPNGELMPDRSRTRPIPQS